VSIGAAVAAARHEASLSLAEVSERTRVRASVIEAIEADDFSHCGGDVYARGHLRAIATAVGVDGQPWVDEYDRTYGTPAPSATEVFEAESVAPRRRSGTNWSALMAAALVLVVGLVVVQLTTGGDDPARTPTTVAEPAPSPTDEPSTEPSDEPTQLAEAEREQVVVRMTALPDRLSWVSVTASDGTVMFEGNIGDGQSKTFRDDKKISVVTGCASSVELTVNGQDVGSPGATCGPITVRFTPDDPAGAAG
jgi:cytoskeleton protein RodZ